MNYGEGVGSLLLLINKESVMKYFSGLLVGALFSLSAFAATQTWSVDGAHSAAGFKVRHMMVSWVHGRITGMKGTVLMDDKTPKSVDVTLDGKTISTDNPKRDEHLRSADFFNMEKNPTITFKSKKVAPGADGTYKVTGDLTMGGKTKEVTFEAKDFTAPVKAPNGDTKRGFTATTRVNRKDFGINWNKTLDGGGVVVGDDVDVTVDVELDLKPETKS
jgi:polyisoprenoid-binding protein YceI